jgi:8-oxo-dGTP pyrophosphatase MutT (NUDIX family)
MSKRVSFFIDEHLAGSVAPAHLEALRAWPRWLHVSTTRVTFSAPDRDGALAEINIALREQGLVKAWRDEFYAVTDLATGARLARTERAASRFWGTLTLGAHANGFVADASGRPTHLWIARRSFTKPTDPGLLDNLIGGGVADGQTPLEALVREGFEEAGLNPAQMAAARHTGVLRLDRPIPEGHQLEDLHCFDLPLPPGLVPVNQDGEVADFQCLPIEQAVALAGAGDMTVDASRVTLHFAARHGFARALSAAALRPEPRADS